MICPRPEIQGEIKATRNSRKDKRLCKIVKGDRFT